MSFAVTAVYASPLPAPSDHHTFAVPAESAMATEGSSQSEQTVHVKAAREAVARMQVLVNTYLTERMEEEKAAAGGEKVEEKVEDNYGEEVVEEDEE